MLPREHCIGKKGRRRCATAALVLMLLAAACMPRSQKDTAEAECPEPVQDCRPGFWQGTPFDTASGTERAYYLKIESVYGLNTAGDEWALHFLDDATLLMTASDAAGQQLRRAVLKNPRNGVRGDVLGVEGAATLGSASGGKSGLVFSAVPHRAVTGDAEVFTATLGSDGLADVHRLPQGINRTLIWDSHPVLSPDGRVLYFASDRPGGVGGTDIWYSLRRPDGSWGEAVNCGPAVNSRCDELTPFVTRDGKRLLFASAGHDNIGGYDIFTARIEAAPAANGEAARFSRARNYGAPLNTPADELFPSTPADPDTLLYYSSNQAPTENLGPGTGGGFDLYVLHRIYTRDVSLADIDSPDPEREFPLGEERIDSRDLTVYDEDGGTRDGSDEASPRTQLPPQEIVLSGEVYDRHSNRRLPDAIVTLRDVNQRRELDRTTSDGDGAYRFTTDKGRELEVSAQSRDHLPDSYRVFVQRNDTVRRIERGLGLSPNINLRINFPNDIYKQPYPYVLDSNGVETRSTWQESLNLIAENVRLFGKNYKKLILIGHTDEKASEEYNAMLGGRRADFVKRELVRRGVPPEMVETRSAGESVPLVRRPGEDLETFYVRCRRVELVKVMKDER